MRLRVGKKEKEYAHADVGEGHPIIVLHGLLGGLSNFKDVIEFFPKNGYRVIIPELPLYTMPMISSNVRSLMRFLDKFAVYKGIPEFTLLGNSLGGHIALLYAKFFPQKVLSMVLTGSSGLYESAMGSSYPKRGSYEFVKEKAESVFYSPEVATKEIVDEVFEVCNNRIKIIKTLAIAKSAIRHNMAKDLPKIKVPTCLIWGKNDNVTPPEVAEEFHSLLPNSDLFWIDKCGHAPMMEHPQTFNEILLPWLDERFKSPQ